MADKWTAPRWELRPSGLIATAEKNRNVRFIARVLSHGEHDTLNEEDEANGRLLELAPEMVEALRRIAGEHYESAQYAREQARDLLERLDKVRR